MISRKIAEQALAEALRTGGDFAELFLQDERSNAMSLLDGRIENAVTGRLHGAGIRIAHKTGEDSGVTHDVGVILTQEPLVVCFVGEHVDVPAYERLMQDAAKMLCE